MPRTAPATWPAPDALNFLPGYRIMAGDVPTEDGHVGDLLRAINHLHAYGTPVIISQGWPGSVWQEAGGPGFVLRCTYRIPEIDPDNIHSSIRCYVYASGDGTANAGVRFRSTGGAVNADIINVGVVGWYGPVNLTLTHGANGYDDVEVYASHGGGAATVVHYVGAEYNPLASPLAAYAPGDTWIPHDDLEVYDAGPAIEFQPLSSRLLRVARSNLSTLHSRPRVYMMWSGLDGYTTGGGTVYDYMLPWLHRVWVPIHPGTSTEPYQLTIHINASNPSAPPGNRYIRLQHGLGSVDLENAFRTTYTVPAGAASWFLGAAGSTIQLSEPREAQGGEIRTMPLLFTKLAVWPEAIAGDGYGTTDNEARIHSIAIWGR